MWSPSASPELIRFRARMLAVIRTFFAERSVVEVETPILSAGATVDPHIESLRIVPEKTEQRYLQTSPEFAMKRLLASGLGDIYQICKVFRAGESGRLHNPEFTLLEWYRLNTDYRTLMKEVASLLMEVVDGLRPATEMSYRDAFLEYANTDPFRASIAGLESCARANGLRIQALDSRDAWLDLLMSEVVSRALPADRITMIFDYPASQASLARVRAEEPPIAERFEVYIGSLEIANGFSELVDAQEQRQRFHSELATRSATGKSVPSVDERFLEAMEAGLPECAGVAVGLDRLLMAASGADHLDQVMAFPWARA